MAKGNPPKVALPESDFGGTVIATPKTAKKPQPLPIKRTARAQPPTAAPPPTSQPAQAPWPTQQIDTGGPPNSTLQQQGVSKSTPTINQDVRGITEAHIQKFGKPPSPGLIYDILKTPFDQTPDWQQLFDIPGSKREAKVRQTAGIVNPAETDLPDPKYLVGVLRTAIKTDNQHNPLGYLNAQSNYSQALTFYQDALDHWMSFPKERDRLTSSLIDLVGRRNAMMLGTQIQAAGWTPSAVGRAVETYVARPISQIAYSTVNMPFGFYQMAKGVGLDSYDLATSPMHQLALLHAEQELAAGHPLAAVHELPKAVPHTADIATRMADQVRQDVQHPIRNSGYLAMDIWAAASLGAGALGKAGRLGALARDSELSVPARVARIPKVILSKPEPKVSDMGFGAYHESLPLSDATVVRTLQEHTPWFGRTDRQARMVAAQTDGFDTILPTWVDRVMSSESMLRRARSHRLQIEHAIALTDVVEMQRLARWDAQAKSVLGDMVRNRSLNWRQYTAQEKIGVQKAIQVMFTDDMDPVNTWRAFHNKQIESLKEGKTSLPDADLSPRALSKAHKNFDYSISAHEAQLAALDLAERVLHDPPPRFQKLIERAYAVAKEQEDLKRNVLGLDDRVAQNHIAEMGAVIRGEKVVPIEGGGKGIEREGEVVPLERVSPTSAYFPTQPMKYQEFPGTTGPKFLRANRFGLAPVQVPFKAWTGDSLQLGDFRWDMTNLLSEQFAKAHHLAMRRAQWHDLWNTAVDEKLSDFHMPIRDVKRIPDDLRETVQAIEREKMDPKMVGQVTDEKLAALNKFLYPSEEELKAGEHFKWVDSRLHLQKIGGMDTQFYQALDQAMSKIMGPINEPMRLALIFATPAYALNALGSAALQLIHEGPLAPLNFGRALMSNHIYGEEVTRLLDRLSGQTYTGSLVSERTMFTKASQGFMEFWQKITDTMFRRAAVIHELRRNGLLKESLSNEEIAQVLQDPANAKQVNLAAQTARKAMMDFQEMTWPERATLRHIFFVYAFVRASGIWSLRFLRDHGFMSDVLAQAGRNRDEELDKLIGKMPDWFMKSGYFAIHPGVIYNPIQWNMPGMLEQTGSPLSALFGNTPYSTPANLLGPAAQFAYGALTGTDTQGKALPAPTGFWKSVPGTQGTLGKSFLNLWSQTPIGQVAIKQAKAKKQAGQNVPLPPVRSGFVDPISAALQRERAGVNLSVFNNDGWMNTWGMTLFRSGMPRQVNRLAGEARYWRDVRANDLPAYHRHELQAVHQMLQRQSQVVGEPVPPEVIQAVDTIAYVSQAIEDYKAAHQGEQPPNQKQLNVITINTLASEGKIKDPQKWLNENAKAVDGTEIQAVQTQVLEAAGGKAWRAWLTRVNAIDNYAQPKFDAAVQDLADKGLGDYTATAQAPRTVRWAYGRQAETVLQRAKELGAQYAARTGYDKEVALQAYLQYVNGNDKPVTVKGVEFPSPFAAQFASKTPQEQQKALASYAKRSPETLTGFQQQLLTGVRPDPIVSKAWQALNDWLDQEQRSLPLGQHLPTGMKDYYEKYLASKSPAFAKSLAFTKLPLAKRMLTYSVVKSSPNKDAWNWVLTAASDRYDELGKVFVDTNGKPKQALISQYWRQHDVPILQAQIRERYGQKFLSELYVYSDVQNPKTADMDVAMFLSRLVSP